MNEIGTLKAANSIPGDMVQTLMGGLTAQTDQAMQAVAVQMEAQAKVQEMSTAMGAVAMMTGVGTKVDTVA
jgi:hypothetical protein